ncbi:galactose mutarotase, partial [Francisella tularensis subsp. holarctica]|nr:galactose mutarotase [Francisella tularensis subsp. holarctica]
MTLQNFNFVFITFNRVMFTTIQKSVNDKFPADVTIGVTYEVLENSIVIYFDAVATADTILNITNHCYYN